jgi:hypothetical protein
MIVAELVSNFLLPTLALLGELLAILDTVGPIRGNLGRLASRSCGLGSGFGGARATGAGALVKEVADRARTGSGARTGAAGASLGSGDVQEIPQVRFGGASTANLARPNAGCTAADFSGACSWSRTNGAWALDDTPGAEAAAAINDTAASNSAATGPAARAAATTAATPLAEDPVAEKE